MEVTLARALKHKNRLVKEISRANSDIQRYNRVFKDITRPIGVLELIKKKDQLVERLVDLKTKLFKANLPVQGDIIRMAELKGEIQHLLTLNTNEYEDDIYSRRRYVLDNEDRSNPPTVIEYDVVLTKGEVDTTIKVLEGRIDDIQERLDRHNATTKIDIDLSLELEE